MGVHPLEETGRADHIERVRVKRYRCLAILWQDKGRPLRCDLPAHAKTDEHRSGETTWRFEPGHYMGYGFGHPGAREKVEVDG